MHLGQDIAVTLTASVFALTGAILSSLTINKARLSSKGIHYFWVLVSGTLVGTTLWLFQFQSFLALEDVEFQNFGITNMYGSLIRTVLLCIVAVALGTTGRRLLDILAGIVLSFALLHNHIDNVAAVIDDARSIHGNPFAFPIAVLVAVTFCVLSFLSRHGMTTSSWFMSTAFLCVAIVVPHEIGMRGISWRESVINTDEMVFVTPNFLFTTMIVFGGMMIAAVGGILILDRQHVSQRVEELERLAFVDPVTGLANRARLHSWLAEAHSLPDQATTYAIGVSSYRNIVEVYGHAAGDRLIGEISSALKELQPSAFVARTSDERFVVISPTAPASEANTGSLLFKSISKEVSVDGNPVSPGIYMGVASWGHGETDVKDTLAKAGLALGRAWRSGATRPVRYDAAIDEPNRNRSSLSIDMKQALKNRQFSLVFQRQNLVSTGEVVGYEVLLRWNHPVKGVISPELFIPLAERDGLIDEIGEWVLMEACREAARWAVPAKIAVNVAPRQLADGAFPDQVRSALRQSGLSPSRLEVEITESSVIADLDQARKIAGELQAIGVSISMDDYGTGYSSLSTLRSFPFAKVKIDKSFIMRMTTDPQARTIVRSTVELCRTLDLDVVAEGVETPEELAMLDEMGCGIAQGYLFGEPVSASELRSVEGQLGPTLRPA